MDEVKIWLEEIIILSSQLLEQNTVPITGEVHNIHHAAERLLSIYPDLAEQLTRMRKREAIQSMSTEWGTPITSILGYSTLLLDGFFGELSHDHQSIIQHIYEYARGLNEWSTVSIQDYDSLDLD